MTTEAIAEALAHQTQALKRIVGLLEEIRDLLLRMEEELG